MITLVAVLCHQLNGVPLCREEIVTDSHYQTMAGKIDAAIPMPGIGWQECQVGAQAIVSKWMSGHPIYHAGWWMKSWKCVPGKYVIKDEI